VERLLETAGQKQQDNGLESQHGALEAEQVEGRET